MADLLYCKVVGTFRGFVADSDDVDDLPEFNIPTGSGVITPNVKMVKLNELEPKIFYPSPTQVVLDAEGRLSQGGRPYVNLLSPTPDMNPDFFEYSIIMNLKFDNNTRAEIWGPYYFVPTAGATRNLFDMVANAPSPTTPGGGTGASGTTYKEDPNNEGFFIPA